MTLRTSDRFVVTWRTHSGRLTDPKFFGELASAEAAAEDLRGQSNVIADSVEVEERPAGGGIGDKTMTRIEWPTLADVTDCVIAYRDELQTYDPKHIADDDAKAAGDIRLYVADDGSSWAIHTGDASYVTGHRGYWGASSITPDMTDDECAGVADDLLLDASIEELSRKPAEDCR